MDVPQEPAGPRADAPPPAEPPATDADGGGGWAWAAVAGAAVIAAALGAEAVVTLRRRRPAAEGSAEPTAPETPRDDPWGAALAAWVGPPAPEPPARRPVTFAAAEVDPLPDIARVEEILARAARAGKPAPLPRLPARLPEIIRIDDGAAGRESPPAPPPLVVLPDPGAGWAAVGARIRPDAARIDDALAALRRRTPPRPDPPPEPEAPPPIAARPPAAAPPEPIPLTAALRELARPSRAPAALAVTAAMAAGARAALRARRDRPR